MQFRLLMKAQSHRCRYGLGRDIACPGGTVGEIACISFSSITVARLHQKSTVKGSQGSIR